MNKFKQALNMTVYGKKNDDERTLNYAYIAESCSRINLAVRIYEETGDMGIVSTHLFGSKKGQRLREMFEKNLFLNMLKL